MYINVSAFNKYVESQLTLDYVIKLIFIGSLIFKHFYRKYNMQRLNNSYKGK